MKGHSIMVPLIVGSIIKNNFCNVDEPDANVRYILLFDRNVKMILPKFEAPLLPFQTSKMTSPLLMELIVDESFFNQNSIVEPDRLTCSNAFVLFLPHHIALNYQT